MWLELIIRLLLSPYIFAPLIYPGLVTALVILLTLIWLERKFAAKVQLRYGPLYVAKQIGGAPQLLADAIRFMFQEVIVPRNADKVPFLLAPVLAMSLGILPIVFIPVAPGFAGIFINFSLPAALALSALMPITIILMAWSANNKFTIHGGVREAFITIAYEIALFVSALSMSMLYSSLSLQDIVEKQALVPGILLNPLAALTFFVAMLMSAGKLPFDIAEGEQEIVAGPYTEYTGILYGLVMGAGYVQLYVSSLIFTELFLGGWHPLFEALGELYPPLGGIALFLKTYLVLAFAVFLRCVYGRYRIDHALRIGWRRLIPLSILALLLSLGLRFVGVVV